MANDDSRDRGNIKSRSTNQSVIDTSVKLIVSWIHHQKSIHCHRRGLFRIAEIGKPITQQVENPHDHPIRNHPI